MADLISVIIPCYNEGDCLQPLYERLCRVAQTMRRQYGAELLFLFVDDGSKDHTLGVIKALSRSDPRVGYLSFSRNFGKESAIYAGMQNSTGNLAAILDADLQHPPELLIDMYRAITQQGYDCAAARRVSRKGEPKLRSLLARIFYRMMNILSKTKFVDGATDFSMMTRQMAQAILEVEEYNRFTKGIRSWVGFETKWLEYENIARAAGETKWSFWKLLAYSMDAILSFTTAPLAVASVSGVLLCLLSFVIICGVIVKTILYGDPVAGFPTLICAVCFIGGIQLFCLGIIGQYLAKMYLEVKRRPIYIIREQGPAEAARPSSD